MKFIATLFSLLLFTAPARADHPFHVEDMEKLSRIGELKISPDGKWIAFTVTREDVAKNRGVTNLWMVAAGGGEPQQLTFADQGFNGGPRWSPDSHFLYFLSSRADDKQQIFRLAMNGGEAKQITSVPTGVDGFFLSPDGKTIAITASVFPQCADMACNEKAAKEKADNPVKVRVITNIPFRRWDHWVDGMRNHIFVLAAAGAGAATDITPGDMDSPIWTEEGSEEVAFSPDGREICFSRYVQNEALTGNSDLFVIPAAGGTPKPITTNKSTDRTPLYSPDGRHIAYSATLRPMQEMDITRLFLYDRTTGEHKNLSEAMDRSIDSYVWAPDSRSLYITYEDEGQEVLSRIDVGTLKVTPMVTAGDVTTTDVARDGSFIAYGNMDFSHPANLFRMPLFSQAGAATQLTDINTSALKDIQFGEGTSFSFKGWDGEIVQAWEVKPPNFDASKKYPLLLLMHGGPENAWDNMFHYRWNAQLFAAAGYVVIMPNFHGSSGFGLKFQDSIKGQWGGAPYQDQMAAVDMALTWPYVDSTRIAAAGASYGGYMANWVEGHTDRFRAIVSHDGVFDMTTGFYSSDFIGGLLQEFKGTPWQNPQALIAQSPVTYAANFKTPMLIIHGAHDYRLDYSEGLAMFQVLQAQHIPSKLLFFEDENHWVLKPADSIFWYHNVLDWLDEWVKPDTAAYRKQLDEMSKATAQ